MSFTMKTAAATVAAAFVAVAAAKAQEVEFDPNQVGEFTRQASLELSVEIAAPTAVMQARFAELEDDTTVKPDMRFAQNDQETEEEAVQVAANW
ncbi:hypothetical protein [Parvularcula marina]|nr:hypothetical protein [Parvularcula marina]